MNIQNSRFLRHMFVFVLLLSMLVACSGKPNVPNEPVATSEPAATSKLAETNKLAETSEPVATSEPIATIQATPVSKSAPAAVGEAGTWLIMLYQDADDPTLEKDIFIDLNESEIVGSTDNVKIVSQLDRFKGGYKGDGDWTSAKRFLVTKDSNLETINSQKLADLGEVDSGNKDTLIDFATWAIGAYPSEHYVLIMSDHGAGWDGGWTDNDPLKNSQFRMQDIDDALGAIIAQTNIGAFELVGFDACLMGQLEVMSAIAPHAKYAVASEETEPALGWAYAKFLQALNDNPAMTGRELSQAIVDSYIDQDFRVTDNQARSVLATDLGATGDVSAKDVVTFLHKGITLSAVDLGAIQNLNATVNELAVTLTKVDQSKVAEARAYAQSYTSIFGKKFSPPYLDLGHFVDLLLANIADPTVKQAAQQVQSALKESVIAETHGTEKPASSGLTIYFPNSTLYQLTFGKSYQYSAYVGRFATASLWDDFLTFHYTGETFDPATADLAVLTPAKSTLTDFTRAIEKSAPAADAKIVPPGAGEITIAPITISANEIAPDGIITLSTVITGQNIGYIYYYVSYYNEEDGSFLTAYEGFIKAEATKESGGIYYPDWGDENVIPIEFTWKPTLYYMGDGNKANDQFAFFEPDMYGVDEDSTTYTVFGVYKFVEDGSDMDAIMSFSGDNKMQDILGFTGENFDGAIHEITPQSDDTFTITEQWLEFDQNPEGEFVDHTGGTMTFGDNRFEMVPYNAYPGRYELGIIVTDLNENSNEEFVEVTVTE